MSAVTPTRHSPSRGAASSSEPEHLYTLVESAPLPIIDISKSIRSAWLSREASRKLAAFCKRFYVTVNASFFVGILISILACFLPAKSARTLACVALIGIPGTIAAITILRYDIVVLLMKTYEFWFFTLADCVSSGLLALLFADSRALIVPMLLFGTLSSILIDANTVVHREFVLAHLFVGCFLVILLVYIAFHMIDQAQEFVLFRFYSRSLSVQDALVNGWANILVLTCRNIYRKRVALRKHGTSSTVVQCISYRCRVKLVPVETTSRIEPQHRPERIHCESPSVASATVSRAVLIPMRFASLDTVFCSKNMLVRSAASVILNPKKDAWLTRLRLLIFGTGTGSLLLGALSFALEGSNIVVKLQAETFICTLLFCGVCGSMYQRQLLHHLLFSFDFAFLSFQLTFVHLGVCDLVRWDSKCFVIGSSWLWMHWVLLIDALTPQVKLQLRLQTRFALLIVTLFILCQIAIRAEILFNPSSALQDRVVYEHALNSGRSVQFRVVPFLLSRLITLLSWSLRIQWRLWTLKAHENELVVIQGCVTYNRAKKPPPRPKPPRESFFESRARISVKPTAVVPPP